MNEQDDIIYMVRVAVADALQGLPNVNGKAFTDAVVDNLPDSFRSMFPGSVMNEHDHATSQHPRLNSLHEGFAVLAEEVDELWDEVRKKADQRDPDDIRTECVQIATVAQRIHDELT